jgi:pimeloyl-ACP methyl ester carboxylesterase
MRGELYKYTSEEPQLCAFETESVAGSKPSSTRVLLYIGGLTGGFLDCAYADQLAEVATKHERVMVQVELSSYRRGYGVSSLAQDVDEIDAFLNVYCARNAFDGDCELLDICLVGYSTGTQIAMLYTRVGERGHSVTSVVLQAPVSDRLWLWHEDETLTKQRLDTARSLIAESSDGGRSELMPFDTDFAPITAYRYNSFASILGDDDYWSEDLTSAQLASRVSHLW